MLSGEYEHGLDEKGRLILPAKFREILGDRCFITKGYDGCLSVYSAEEWDKFLQKLILLMANDKNPNARKVLRTFSSGGVESSIDKQGRVLIPASLREYAHITKDIKIIGVLDKIELWDKQTWEDYNDAELSLEDAALALDELL